MIFEDPSKRRWKITLGVFISLVIVGISIFVILVYGLMTNPELPGQQKTIENKKAAVATQARIQKNDRIQKTNTPPIPGIFKFYRDFRHNYSAKKRLFNSILT